MSDCGADGYHVDGYIANRSITITYDPSGGSFGEGMSTDSSGKYKDNATSGQTYTIIENAPTRDEYVFAGWKLGDMDTICQPHESITPTGNVTLVAQWRSRVETVTLTYHENFGETEHTYTISVDKNSEQTVQSYAELRRLYGVFRENTRFYFDKWNTQSDGKGRDYTAGFIIPMTGSIDLYAQWKQARVPKVAYTINQHFINEKNQEITTLANSQYKSAEQGAVLNNLITATLKENKTDSENNVYVYIADKTTFKVGTTEVGGTATLSSKDTVIDLYYYLNNWKDADEAGKDSATGGDGIPDCYQVLVNYQSGNADRGSVGPLTMEVLTIKNEETQENASEGQVRATGSTATATGSSRNYFSNWTDKTGTEVGTTATLGELPFNAVGGETYTFTANFGRSSGGGSGGSSRPSTPPTVEIPDDVPTGLNGKDHYAYIIGYGNNDVRPQNNVTRAEVATIFFRLLTDETREANMTKSNGYNDVKDGDWFCYAVSTLSKMGIIKGYEDGSFKPNDPISRAEFAAIAARFDPDGDKTPASFFDVTSHWAKDEISIAANHVWIKGYEDGSFKPDQKITRAETMTLVNRVLNRLPETKDDLHKDMKTWVDNMDETAWYYLAVQEATNSHYFKNKTGTQFEQWTDLRDTRDWSELEK
ncbi:MAG: S-layer homology domain-containing protein [Firmicutes bacterium]|nr:S-layer homology domain-containing protein [Bacillota bacterium]